MTSGRGESPVRASDGGDGDTGAGGSNSSLKRAMELWAAKLHLSATVGIHALSRETDRHRPPLANALDRPDRVLELGLGKESVRPDVIVIEQVAEVFNLRRAVSAWRVISARPACIPLAGRGNA